VQTRLLVRDVLPGSPARGKLKPGDEVVAVDGEPVDGGSQLRDLITGRDPGDRVRVVVLRNGRRLTTTIRTTEAEDGRPIVGITTRDVANYPFEIKNKLKDVGGPSAGLMFALGIVDKLTPGSLTGGKHVAGTGTIDDRGHVGAIGGITQKMIGARDVGATVFLVPPGNCDEAVGTRPDGLRLVRADTLTSAVSALERLAEGRGNLPAC
jgi:PDZ domain-containing protein